MKREFGNCLRDVVAKAFRQAVFAVFTELSLLARSP